ncbi:hypothetical protein ACTMU2_36070 (plasmid) [Cupriavidus basilensis]
MLASVLFMRLAIAGYVCPTGSGDAADAMAIAATEPCQGMDQAQPALCADHQQDGRHWADNNGHSPDLGLLPAMASGPAYFLAPIASAGRAPLTAAVRHHPPPDPVYLATARLRI